METRHIFTLNKKDGSFFKGTAYECARVLMGDGLLMEMKTGVPYGRWEAEEFCRKNNIKARDIISELKRR